ncbi:uncharacterized protein LOC124409445 [Diprion similis]|uniref:uncharacterized protein LOC124409445 n=1 Tax=Diprion similis TaxID=362088 RepID=UPI001EF7BF4B|nr:uncharacterized protein LOC124409445 [Diprion similis]
MRNVKTERSMQFNYGDGAIGYVQVLREKGMCTVEAKICPEHRIRNKNYTVRVVINEKDNTVMSTICDDCATSMGGCRHAVALLAWIHRRTGEPAPTSIACYWKKPKLSDVGTSIKYKKILDILPLGSIAADGKNDNQQETFLEKILKSGKSDTGSHLIKFFSKSLLQGLSMHQNAVLHNGDKQDVQVFLDYVAAKLTNEACTAACSTTMNQNENHSWYELRYGRITASVIYEAAHSNTIDGTLVEKILSPQSFDTIAMKRGRMLESQMLQKVTNRLQKKIDKCGLLLSAKFPEFGASPDGICDDAVIEVKCRMSSRTVKNYYTDGKVHNKFKAQIQLQMLFHEKNEGYFCIADPGFEDNGNVSIVIENFDENYMTAVMKRASAFWKILMKPKMDDQNRIQK